MNKIAINISGAPSLFDEIITEAARLDRSPSWLLGECLGKTLPKLAAEAIRTPPPRAKAPAKRQRWTFFVARDLMDHCSRLATRLGMSSDDVLAYAWRTGRNTVFAMPSS